MKSAGVDQHVCAMSRRPAHGLFIDDAAAQHYGRRRRGGRAVMDATSNRSDGVKCDDDAGPSRDGAA